MRIEKSEIYKPKIAKLIREAAKKKVPPLLAGPLRGRGGGG